jgi:lysozyme family protein
MGPNRAIKVLQQAVGCDLDGAFGDKTKSACDSCDLGEAMINYCDIREGIYRTLAKRPGQDNFLTVSVPVFRCVAAICIRRSATSSSS